MQRCWFVIWILASTTTSFSGNSIAPPSGATPAERGLWFLLNKNYITSEFSQEDFDNLWQVWQEPLRSEAAANSDKRRAMAYDRYGLIEMPGRDLPMGFVPDGKGGWGMNCLACHGGKVAGQVIPGLGNTYFAFQTLTQDVRVLRRARNGQGPGIPIDAILFPLGWSNGTTNAQVAAVALTALRDSDLNFRPRKSLRVPKLLHHDLDAPPWWVLKKKKMLYVDGYVEKSHRVIMQFVLLPDAPPERIKSWDDDFRDILAFAESVVAPCYPGEVDHALAEAGRILFNNNCADCHGTYGPGGSYPEKRISIEEVGTDRRRLDGIPLEHRRFFRQGWIGEEGQVEVVEEPDGYVAPPLDGLWASAPYFHNGAVPTLWHVLHPADRPRVWKRTLEGYDHDRVGLQVEEFDVLPSDVKHPADKRRYFDTRLPGKSSAGHDFPDALRENEKRAVLEYLKTI